MDLLVSKPTHGALCAVGIGSTPRWSPPQIASAPAHHVTRLLVGNTPQGQWLAVVRAHGLIQLYQRQIDDYVLYKEWKNATVKPSDNIVAVGFVAARFLYSCSADGKFVVRDLVNDDADESCRVYHVSGPVSAVDVAYSDAGRSFTVATAGKHNELSVYTIESTPAPAPDTAKHNFNGAARLDWDSYHHINLSSVDLPRGRWRRSSGSALASNLLIARWHASTSPKDYLYTCSPHDTLSCWISSVVMVGGGTVACGTQMGELVVYNHSGSLRTPTHRVKLSSFGLEVKPAANHAPPTDLVYFTDGMALAGVIDISRMEIIQKFDISSVFSGPIVDWHVYRGVHRNQPWFMVASAMDNTVAVLSFTIHSKLPQVKWQVGCDTTVPSVCVSCPPNQVYNKLMGVFESATPAIEPHLPRRRQSAPASALSETHVAASASATTTSPFVTSSTLVGGGAHDSPKRKLADKVRPLKKKKLHELPVTIDSPRETKVAACDASKLVT
ncbi:hypothetical protein DIURU_005763 [Diutina rugosa]|uniref:Ribosome biogenesis protein NSA1 n=1 Tax=Diutina rugosa TaxID=5481 RepID=A0A642UC14_DIURU|nr:uncharacterized protein DIURU_005763 [Diutina rugosa]KAA8896497.1 hypothetical protein DIURU_005763 [Diutina rugosa]